MLRPSPARWFEILTARDDVTVLLEALARTGAVELESRPGAAAPPGLAEVTPLLASYLDLQARYQAYWPAAAECRPSAFPQAPLESLQQSLATLRAWMLDAEPLIQALQQAQAEQHRLHLWQRVLPEMHHQGLDASLLATAGPWLQVRLLVLPPGTAADALLAADAARAVCAPLSIDGAPHLLVTAEAPAMQVLAQQVATIKGSLHEVPAWLQADPAANERQLQERLAAAQRQEQASRSALQASALRHGLHRALGDANRLQWVWQNVHALEADELLCWVTGWFSERAGTPASCGLARAVQRCGARALLHFATAPPGARAPLLLRNPAWARPFEIFSRALGMPGATEADPSPLLALAVPLMFGYMFGDVGQGLLIAAVAAVFRRRWPIARLLMIGGLSAAAFGVLFGSTFGLHMLVPAAWVHPLEAPLQVLLAPLIAGAVLLTLGLLLDALSAWWRGEITRWLLTDAALVVLYLALLASFITPAALFVAAAAALYFCVGHALVERRLAAAVSGAGQALEKTLQILINTLSFARVGAFALAHAGLSSAIVALMAAADSSLGQGLVFVLGNALVIVLEAMVVSIQTTRLVLFEFFTRFMQGQGRSFRPLPPPPFTLQEN